MRTVATATFDDLTYIGSWLCDADRTELAATRDPDDYVSLAKDAMKGDHHYVALDNAVPVLAFGATRPVEDYVIVWGFKTAKARPVMPLVTRYIVTTMIPAIRAAGTHRARCLVHVDNAPSIKWLTRLGFHPKADLLGFGAHAEDMCLYEWLPPDAQRPADA